MFYLTHSPCWYAACSNESACYFSLSADIGTHVMSTRLCSEYPKSFGHSASGPPLPTLARPLPGKMAVLSGIIAQCLNLKHEIHHTASKLCILGFEPLK